MRMADPAPSISQLTNTCRHELDELSSSHRDAVKRIGHDTLSEPPTALHLLAWVPEQKTKLNLFADVLGVFAPGSLSVEHRLRNNSAVRSSIAQLLEAISKNLCLCIRSRVQLVEHQRTTDDDPIEPAPAYHVTKIACRRIGRDVANLVRFAALIRLRSMQQYRERSEHHEPLDHDGLPLGDYFDKVVTRVLKETFEDRHMAGLLDGPSQYMQQSVPQRIKQTVTSRWKRICYHIARYQQLRGSDRPVEENMDDDDIVMEDVQFDADVKPAVPLGGDRIHASKNLVIPQHEKATTFQGSLNEQVKVPQPPSITPSVALTNVAGLSVRMPKLRKQDVTYENGMLDFLCPLCKIPQQLPSDKSAVQQHRAWEKHAFYDLEPYICLLDCKTPEATYRTFEDWTRHINSEHARYTWQCQNCTQSCDNQAAFEHHLRTQHEAKLTAGELAFVAKTCERPVAAFSACFFCGKYELSGQTQAENKDAAAARERKMMHCMAQHMRSMALTSLPDQLSVSDGSAESAARVSDTSAPFRTVTQSNAKSTDPSSEAFESIISQLKVQYEVTDGRAEFTNEWRLNSDLMSSDNRPADLPQLMLDPETLSQQYWVSTLYLDCVGEGPPRYDGTPLTFDHNEPLSEAVNTISSYWSVPEQIDFVKYIAHFGTDFAAIANYMGTKSQVMVKNHFQRLVDAGRPDLAMTALEADQSRARGEDMGPPPISTAGSKRKHYAPETSVWHGSSSQTWPVPLDAGHPEFALETTQNSTDGGTRVLSAIEDHAYMSHEDVAVGEIKVIRGDRMPSDDQDENRFASQTYPGPSQQEGQDGGPSRSITLPGMDQDSAKSPVSNKRHKCPYCATEFTRHHNLKSHLLTHSQEKPYVCQTCQARFRRLHDLKRHTKLHSGERPHTCDKCGRKFARDDALARHNKAPGGCAGGRSSFGDEDHDGGGTYNEDLLVYDGRPFDGGEVIVFASNHRYQGGIVMPSSNPPPNPNFEPAATFREPSENTQPFYSQPLESSSVQDPFEFFGVKNPRPRAIPCRSLSIGTWKVVGRTVNDLSVSYWIDQPIVAYFFKGNGMGCRIEYPFAWIKHITADELVIELIRPPKFYRDANFTGEYVECSDFTNDKQASQIMTHRLEGHNRLSCLEFMKSLDIYRQRHDNASAAVDSGLPYPHANMMKRPIDKFPTLDEWEEADLPDLESEQERMGNEFRTAVEDEGLPCIFHVGEPLKYPDHTRTYRYVSQLLPHLRALHGFHACLRCFTLHATASQLSEHVCMKCCTNTRCRRYVLFGADPPTVCQCITTMQEQWQELYKLQYNSLDEAATSRNAAPSTIGGDEYTSHDVDRTGELKVSKDGQLRGGREYQCRTFTLPGRGTTLYMLATECARVLGYRDSDILFNEHQTLDKIVIGQAEKDDLLDRNILPRFDRARQVAVVTARSMFRQFGSHVIEDGQPGRDDYWEADAQHQVHAGFDLPSSGFGDESPSHSGTRDLVGNSPSKVHEAVPPVPLPIDSTSADPLRDSKRSLIPRTGRKRPAISCLACSEQKIRCDPGEQGCMQCEEAGRLCRMANAESSREPAELSYPLEAQQSRAVSCVACKERKVRCDPGDNGCLQCAERGTPCRMLSRRRLKPSGPASQDPMPLEQHETTQPKAPEIARPEDSMDVDTDDEGGQVPHQARVHNQQGGHLNTVPF